MVFLVFLEVLEMSSEVVGPGPNTREIKSLRVDPGPLACVQGLPAHDYNTILLESSPRILRAEC